MYATAQDIIDRNGKDAVLIATDSDFDGEPDHGKIEQALVDAADEINSYIGKRYTLPLPEVPSVLTRISVDIAFYRLSPESAHTDEKRKRYEDAKSWLSKVSMGSVSLGLPSDTSDDTSPVEQKVELDSQPRMFNRRSNNRIF